MIEELSDGPARLTPVKLLAAAAALGLLVASHAPGAAQNAGGDVDIEADQMQVLEEEQRAIFTGSVDARRGDVTLNSDELVVHYSEIETENGSKKTEVTDLDANGNIVIVTRTQRITGDWAKMNVASNKVEVGGNVTVEQSDSVIRGSKLLVDLETDQSQVLGGEGGRVKGTFSSGQ